MPHRVGGVGDDGRAPLLAVVGELRQAAPLAGLDGHLQVRVWVEEHALLQAHRPDVCRRHNAVVSICGFTLHCISPVIVIVETIFPSLNILFGELLLFLVVSFIFLPSRWGIIVWLKLLF